MYGGSGTAPAGLAVEPHPPAPLAQMLEQLDRAVTVARAQLTRRARERLPDLAVDRLEQQHLAARLLDRDARRDDPRVVHDHQRESISPGSSRNTWCDTSPVARRKTSSRDSSRCADRMLRDQLLRQVVVELTGLHPVRTVASPLMEEIREALRDGLREEAAPIARRLAEVKGLSNNVIRRLDRLEHTIDAERDARVDDLALLVDLLTEGWRGAERTPRPDRSGARRRPRRTS